MRIGPWELHSVETGRFRLDGGAMFGIVPKTLWEKAAPADEKNRIRMSMRALLLRGLGRTILVDDGAGSKLDPKFVDIYGIDHGEVSVERSLARLGLTSADVTDVILTHLHFDHAGGSTVRRGSEVVPSFPRARYYVQRAHWDLAHAATEKEAVSFMPENYEPLAVAGVLEFLDGPRELFPGVALDLFHGHTDAMQLPRVTGPEGTLFYCADLIPTFAHLQPIWLMGYDCRPLVTLQEKKDLLPRAEAENWLLFSEHDPDTAAARVARDPRGRWTVRERVAV